MHSEVWSIIGAIAGSVLAIALIVGGLGYFWSSFVTGKNQKEVDEDRRQDRVDKTLKDLVEAQEKRFLLLESDHKENLKQIGQLQGIISEQAKQQKWFEGIFVSALKAFFKENPHLASELKAKIDTTKAQL